MHFLRFDNNRLDMNGYEIDDLDYSQLPDIKLSKYSLARSDGSVITARYYGEKKVPVKGRIIASSTGDMNTKLDALKIILSGVNKNLDLEINSEYRRVTATVESFATSIKGYSCFFDIVFSCSGVLKSVDSTSLSLTNPITTTPNTNTVTVGGTYKAPLNVDLTLNSFDKVAMLDTLRIENTTNGSVLAITRDWRWFDRVVVDGDRKSVTVYPAITTTVNTFDTTTGVTITTASTTASITNLSNQEGIGLLELAHTGASTTIDFEFTLTQAINLSYASTGLATLLFMISTLSPTSVEVRLGSGGDTTTNYVKSVLTTDYAGAAIGTSSKVMKVDLTSLTTVGTGATTTAINKVRIIITKGSTLNGTHLIDFMYACKSGGVPSAQDYEGTIPMLEPGTNSIKVTDPFTARNISYIGNYSKRYL